jgi:uncharacterized 2Fe-2S/4Fe-4S cluster protein (DUF4445 family)
MDLREEPGIQVTFQPLGKRVMIYAGATLLQAGMEGGIFFSSNCGGVGLCGRCRVKLLEGKLEAPTEAERVRLSSEELQAGWRLACEARIAAPVVISMPQASSGAQQRFHIGSNNDPLACDPLIFSCALRMVAPYLEDTRADAARACQAAAAELGSGEWSILPRAATQLTTLAREHNWNLMAFLRGSEIIGVSRPGRHAAGLAVDLGCTKIAGYLVDLESGRQLCAAGIPNPQLSYGEDLISRLVYAGKGTSESMRLAMLAREAIDSLAGQLCSQVAIERHEIADACIVGNTAMIHLLLHLPVMQLLHAPFIASLDSSLDIESQELDIHLAPGARIHILPSIGGFVGADHVAMILAHGIDRSERTTVGIDIGTNTEIVLRNPSTGAFVTTSVPSGPAFEGGHIKDGMRAAQGAIERVFSQGGELRFKIIDGVPPVGICGSGVVDVVAELYNLGYLNERGHLQPKDDRVRKAGRSLEFLLVAREFTGHGNEIVFTQHDVSEVQLAKGAIRAGIESLMEITCTKREEIREIAIAGAFGSYIDLRNAVGIGLLPHFPNTEYLQIGNAAGRGAKMALVSRAERERARKISAAVQRIELKRHTNFNRLLARATRLPGIRSDS